jgi:hypothetical protein
MGQISLRIAALMLAAGTALGHAPQAQAAPFYYAYVRYVPFNSTTAQTVIYGPFGHPVINNGLSQCMNFLNSLIVPGTLLRSGCMTESPADDPGDNRTD